MNGVPPCDGSDGLVFVQDGRTWNSCCTRFTCFSLQLFTASACVSFCCILLKKHSGGHAFVCTLLTIFCRVISLQEAIPKEGFLHENYTFFPCRSYF